MSVIDNIYKALDSVNDTLPPEQQVEKSPETSLFGPNSKLDSLSLVTLIAELEGLILEEDGIQVTIADERAMSQENSPFLSVQRLSEYVEVLVNEQK